MPPGPTTLTKRLDKSSKDKVETVSVRPTTSGKGAGRLRARPGLAGAAIGAGLSATERWTGATKV